MLLDTFYMHRGEVNFLDAGHFALETHHQEIAAMMRDFLGRHEL